MSTTKPYKGVAMEGVIATWYAKTTVRDLSRHKEMAAMVAARLAPPASVLEIAPGPGYFCVELAKLDNYQITGLDISRSFVEIARRNAAAAGVQVDFRLGNASAMPFNDNTFDLAFCQAAFKNFTEPVKAIREMYRVLRPHGTAIIVDMRSDATDIEIRQEVEKLQLGALDRLMTTWTFHSMLRKSAYSVPEMESMVAQTPFGRGKFTVGGIGFQLLLEK